MTAQERKEQTPNEPEHAVIVDFKYDKKTLATLYRLEWKLKRTIWIKRAGEYDGHEMAIGLSSATLYMYGPNAEKLFAAIKSTLKKQRFLRAL